MDIFSHAPRHESEHDTAFDQLLTSAQVGDHIRRTVELSDGTFTAIEGAIHKITKYQITDAQGTVLAQFDDDENDYVLLFWSPCDAPAVDALTLDGLWGDFPGYDSVSIGDTILREEILRCTTRIITLGTAGWIGYHLPQPHLRDEVCTVAGVTLYHPHDHDLHDGNQHIKAIRLHFRDAQYPAQPIMGKQTMPDTVMA